jgi:hypothetical protein
VRVRVRVLAVDRKAGRAWRRPIDERCEGLHLVRF